MIIPTSELTQANKPVGANIYVHTANAFNGKIISNGTETIELLGVTFLPDNYGHNYNYLVGTNADGAYEFIEQTDSALRNWQTVPSTQVVAKESNSGAVAWTA